MQPHHQIHPLIVLEENITEANLWVRTTPGMWRILYQAQSKDGVWSDIVQGEVQAQGSSGNKCN